VSTEVEVSEIPPCDICKRRGETVPAIVDGATIMGPWANMCELDFVKYGVGLGTGRGQRLILRGSNAKP
jgi:hypothetical protein